MKWRWIEILLNAIFWVTTSLLIISSFSIQSQEIELVNDIERVKTIRSETLIVKLLICIGISAVSFYLNFFLLLNLSENLSKWRIWAWSGLIFTTGFLAIYLLTNLDLGIGILPLPYPILIGIPAFYFSISIGYGIAKIWHKSELRQQQLLIAKNKAELSLLRSQLQPHFLFNALNNLLSMVDQKTSPKLAESFGRLSNLLRYIIEKSKNEKVYIKDEISFLKDYISMQLMRFEEDEVKIDFNVKGAHMDQLVEPGLFIPLVENAFKFGTEPENNAYIKVEFNLMENNKITFTIENRKLQFLNENVSTHTGIKALQRRLSLVYPNSHILNIIDNVNFKVELILQNQ